MPARRLRLGCSHFFTLLVVVFVVPALVQAQTDRASATVRGSVSKTVALSVVLNFSSSGITTTAVSTGSTVQLTLSSTDGAAGVIRLPLLVRSNSGFKITAALESTTAALAQISVGEVRSTGKLVSPGLVSALDIAPDLNLNSLDASRPTVLLSGPRVSLGGKLDSPNNALEVTLLISVPQPVPGSPIQLTLVATPE